MGPIDGFLKIAGYLIDLAKLRDAQRERRFKLVVEPMLKTMHDVHKDSLLMMESARNTLAKTRSFGDTYADFRAKRLVNQGCRHDLVHRCMALHADPKLDDCRDFLTGIKDYLIAGPSGSKRLSERTETRLVRHAAAEDPNVDQAIAELDFEIKQLEEAWIKASIKFAKATAEFL